MTNAQPNDDIESRLSRLERLMASNGNLLVETSSLARRNAADFDRMLEVLNRVVAVTERNALDIEALTQDIRRNASDIRALSAANEQHDRILDYLLRREAGDIDSE
jgi:uncharacterized protein YpuA (DUF1002 family)